MDDLNLLAARKKPTPNRPLLGMTILVVEDSRFACEAMRLMCLRSGARIRRADCLASARRHLQVYRPSAVILDMGLPDGSGLELIEELNRSEPRVSVLLGLSGDDGAEQAAMAAGADGFLTKPLGSLAQFQAAILSVLPAEKQPIGPRVMPREEVDPDPMALLDDMSHVANLLDHNQEGPMLDYVAQFLGGVAVSAEDKPLAQAARDLARSRQDGAGTRHRVSNLMGLLQDRLRKKAAI